MPSRIVAGIGLSHVPSVGPAVDRKREQEPAWKPLFDAYVPVREWLRKLEPDGVLVRHFGALMRCRTFREQGDRFALHGDYTNENCSKPPLTMGFASTSVIVLPSGSLMRTTILPMFTGRSTSGNLRDS